MVNEDGITSRSNTSHMEFMELNVCRGTLKKKVVVNMKIDC